MRRRALSIIALCGLIAIAMLPAQAAAVDPIKVDGGSTCGTVDSAGTLTLTISPVKAGTFNGPGGVQVVLSNVTRTTFDFSTIGGAEVYDVIVKGSASNWYDYDGSDGGGEISVLAVGDPVTSDAGLTIPNGNKLNLIHFCYLVGSGISGTKFDDGNANGEADAGDVGIPGWTIYLFQSGEEFDSVVTDSNGNYSFPDLGAGTYTVCEDDDSGEGGWQQSGPQGPDNNVCDGFFEGGLAPGGYVVEIGSNAVGGLDFFNFQGESIGCGDDVFVGGGDGDFASGSFVRLDNETCDEGDVKGVRTGIEDDAGDEVIVFIPSGFGTSEYTGELILFKEATDPDLLVLQYDPDGSGFRDVPACIDATFVSDGEGGATLESADIPPEGEGEDESWCFSKVEAAPAGGGTWRVTWQVFGLDDPRFK